MILIETNYLISAILRPHLSTPPRSRTDATDDIFFYLVSYPALLFLALTFVAAHKIAQCMGEWHHIVQQYYKEKRVDRGNFLVLLETLNSQKELFLSFFSTNTRVIVKTSPVMQYHLHLHASTKTARCNYS